MKNLVIKIGLVLTILLASNLYASWPKKCGHDGQKTCMGPIHHGCKGSLTQCDMPNARDICKKKGKCPSNSRNKHKCKKCGHKGQKPCLFKKYCHTCVKGYHLSLVTGKCKKSEDIMHSITDTLEDIDRGLTKAEGQCHKFLNKIEDKFNKKSKKGMKKLLNSVSHSKKLVSNSIYFTGLAETCYEEEFNGVACGVLPWLKSYNALAIKLLNVKHKESGEKSKLASKDAIKIAEKYIHNFINGNICKYVFDMNARAVCAAITTIAQEGKKPATCAVNTVKDLFNQKSKSKKHSKKGISKKDIREFVATSSYQIGQTAFSIAADQGIAALTAGAAEEVELSKNAKAILKAIKAIAKAKIQLEDKLSSAEAAKISFNHSTIKKIMKKHKSCKKVLKYLE